MLRPSSGLTLRASASLVIAGLVMAVSQVASVTGRVLWGVLADRALARRTMLGLLGLGSDVIPAVIGITLLLGTTVDEVIRRRSQLHRSP